MRTSPARISSDLGEEACRFARYLIGDEPDAVQLRLYERAITRVPGLNSKRHDPLLRAAKSPLLLPFLDAGTAWLRLDCALRRRLLVATAILEASPRHADRFLPVNTSLWELFAAGFRVALRGALLIPVGVLLVKMLHRP